MTPQASSFWQQDQALGQHNFYETQVRRPTWPTLQGSHRVDVVVVGAGFAGLSAALELSERGYSVIVLEAGCVCAAASGRNGGQAIVGYACGQKLFEQQLGHDAAAAVFAMSREALDLIDARIAKHQIDCERVNGYIYVADSPRKAKELRQEAELLQRHGIDCEIKNGTQVQQHLASRRYVMSLRETVSGHLQPLQYGLGLAQACGAAGVRIFEHSTVHRVTPTPGLGHGSGAPVVAQTDQGQVQARYAVLAGNYLLPKIAPQLAPAIRGRIMPVGTYIIATEPLGRERAAALISQRAAVCDNNFVLNYFRISGDYRLLFGGRVSYCTYTPPGLAERMRARMVQIFPQLSTVRVDYCWGGFVDISMNRAPDIGRLHDSIYYMQGFSGHGVAATGLMGRLVAEALHGDASRFDVFARLKHRTFPGGNALRMPILTVGMLYYRLRDVLL